jgi:hypothetical protein
MYNVKGEEGGRGDWMKNIRFFQKKNKRRRRRSSGEETKKMFLGDRLQCPPNQILL